jgi:putative hydrolase of the HAD superfamily
MPVEAVTFDFWDTLVAEHGDGFRDRQMAYWFEALADAGEPVTMHRLQEGFRASWRRYEASWLENRQYRNADATGFILEALGLHAVDGLRGKLVAAFERVGREADMQLADGIAKTLAALKERGLKLGIVSDVGMTPSNVLRERLDGFGLLRFFDHWSFSDEVGCFKPHAPIFEHALSGLGVGDPARSAHVGDRHGTDVAGALGMGMVAVRYTAFRDEPAERGPEADHVILHHSELLAALGLG